MNKSPEAFRTISEVAEALDVPPHVLRFWETRFTQIKPVKRGGGRRYYRPEDVCLLRGIRGLLYDDGMTIKGVQKILRERGIRHVITLGSASVGEDAGLPEVEQTPLEAPEAASAELAPPVPEEAQEVEPSAPQAASQVDLFENATESDAVSLDFEKQPLDKTALRTLVGELEALRAEMVA